MSLWQGNAAPPGQWDEWDMPRTGPKKVGLLLDKERLGPANESQGTPRLWFSRPVRKGIDTDHLFGASYSRNLLNSISEAIYHR